MLDEMKLIGTERTSISPLKREARWERHYPILKIMPEIYSKGAKGNEGGGGFQFETRVSVWTKKRGGDLLLTLELVS